jgi:hypothetical protein
MTTTRIWTVVNLSMLMLRKEPRLNMVKMPLGILLKEMKSLLRV